MRPASPDLYINPRSSHLTIFQYQTSLYSPTKKSREQSHMWREERDVSTKTKYTFEICNMRLALFVRLKIDLRSRHVVLSSKIQQKTMPCALHTQHARSVSIKAQAARNMSATSVPRFIYKPIVAISVIPHNNTHFKYQKPGCCRRCGGEEEESKPTERPIWPERVLFPALGPHDFIVSAFLLLRTKLRVKVAM